MTPEQLQNKKLLLVGLGLTGVSVARFLQMHELSFDVADESAGWENAGQTHTEATPVDFSNCVKHDVLSAELCIQYDVILLSPGVPRAHPAIVAAVENGVSVIGDIELFASVATKPIIAVTGSNGKSTVVSWVAAVLQQAGQAAVLCGNIGKPALDALTESAAVYVLELSSYQLESTSSLKPFSAVVLNISDDHMDRYASLAEYAKVKRTIYKHCAHRVFNADDKQTHLTEQESAQAAYGSVDASNNVSYSLVDNSSARYTLKTEQNDTFLCRDQHRVLKAVELQLPGLHNVANALAVMSLLDAFALDNNQLREGLMGFSGLVHRTQLIRDANGVRWYNDSKGTNIDACEKAILAMNGPVVLIAGGLGKGADFTELRNTVKQQVKALVLIGRDAQLIADALDGCVEAVHFAHSMADAVNISADISSHGDVVLLSPACASFDMFKNFEVRGEQFVAEVERLAA